MPNIPLGKMAFSRGRPVAFSRGRPVAFSRGRPVAFSRGRPVAALAATAAALLAAAPALAFAAAPAAASAPSAPSAPSVPPAGIAPLVPAVVTAGLPDGRAAQQVFLISGAELVVGSVAGRRAVSVQPGSLPWPLASLRPPGHDMEVPVDAMPYLGRGLDPRLFEPGALGNAESGGRLPVRVTFTGHRPQIPGLTVTGSTAGTTRGYLTAASAGRFGAALQRQYRADHARGRYGADGLFAHGVRIWLAGTSPGATPMPARHLKLYTLTVEATGLHGKPDTGDCVSIASVDNPRHFKEQTKCFSKGSAKFSVPGGDYWAVANFDVGRIVILPQFTVDRNNVTVRVAATAAQEITLTVPRPAAASRNLYNITIARGARNGGSSVFQLAWGSGTHIWISPTARKPTVGTLSFFFQALLSSPSHVSPSYDYNLDIPGPPGIIPRPDFHVTAASLATVTERFYQDVPSFGTLSLTNMNRGLPSNAQPLGEVQGHHMPQALTEYFSAGHGLAWEAIARTECGGVVAPCLGGQGDAWRAFTGGHHLTEEWNKYPLHPAPNTARIGRLPVSPVRPSAARIGNSLLLDWTPFSDNQAGHLGLGFAYVGIPETGSYAVYQDGVQIAHGSPLNGIPAVGLSARPSTIRFVLTASRRNRLFPLSPSSQTTWTWRSARDPAARVPAGWYCSDKTVSPTRQCAVQPLMTLGYQVQGLSLSGLTKPGPQVIELMTGHIPLAKTAGIIRATAQVSYNDGRTWRPAAVTAQGRGRFRITFTVPASTGVTTRVSATDAAGSSITETIQNGYGVAP